MYPFNIAVESMNQSLKFMNETAAYQRQFTEVLYRDHDTDVEETIPYELGKTATEEKTVTKRDIRDFAELTGDTNPLHVNESEAESGPFGELIGHGVLSLGIVSSSLAKFEGDILINEFDYVDFRNPVKEGDTIIAKSTINELDGREATVDFVVETEDGENILSGSVSLFNADGIDLS